MARSKQTRKGKIDLGKVARRLARASTGQPPAERIIPDKRRKPTKHKKRDWDEQ